MDPLGIRDLPYPDESGSNFLQTCGNITDEPESPNIWWNTNREDVPISDYYW